MKNIGIVITDGVGFRNFILSDFIIEIKKTFDKVIIFSCLPKDVYNEFNLGCEIIELDVFNENFSTWFFRKAKEVAHLQLHKKNNFGIQDNLELNRSTSKTPRGIATRCILFATKWINSESSIQFFNKCQQLTFKKKEITKTYQQLLTSNKITTLFFTHQRPPYIAPLLYAAEKNNIKTAAFIFSWDNLASKGRMAGDFDKYLVWSDLMKNELLRFYTKVKPNAIEVVGTPQFEPYVLKKYESDTITINGFDASKKTIFFTCNDASSKNDIIYLEVIANFIQKKQLNFEVNFIVRTSPAEEPNRFFGIKEKYPFILWDFPKWIQTRANHQESWSQRIPTIEDVKNLRSFLEHCDVCVNVLSTITLDVSIFGKPVINPVFGNLENGMFNDQKFLNYEHLDNVIKTDAVYLAKNENELLEALNDALANPSKRLKQQKQLIAQQIGVPLAETNRKIASVLYKWSN
jgi:hypothetical protein